MKTIFKRATALLLSLLMVFSVCSTALIVYATDGDSTESESKGSLNYVSLGDSMTNGYGLEGYNHNSGVADYGTGSYPNQFATALAGKGYDVDHAQLSMSGIRTEDIHWLLEFDYNDSAKVDLVNRAMTAWTEDVANEWYTTFGCGDYWTVEEICDHGRTDATFAHIAGLCNDCEDDKQLVEFPASVPQDGSYTRAEKAAVIAKYYQEKVASADVISLSVGNGNLGVFGFGRILEVISFSDDTSYLNYNYEDVLRECEPEMQARLVAMIEEIKPTLLASGYSEELVNVALYIAVSLAMNYAGTLDRILQMNSDAEIILIPVMNTFGDTFATVEGELTIGDLLGLVIDPLNKFIAGLPTYMQVTNHEIYKEAKFYWAEADKSIQCMVDTYTYPIDNAIVRDRFVESIVGGGSGLVWKMLPATLGLVAIDLTDVETYSKDGAAGLYTKWTTQTEAAVASVVFYLEFEEAVVACKDKPVTLESVMGLGNMTDDLFAPVMAVASSDPTKISDALVADETLSGLLALFARCVIGNGIGAHPSQEGHNTLAKAVADSYGVYTAENETDANLNFEHTPAVKEIVSYLTANGYLTDEQILNIAFYACGLVKDGELTSDERKTLSDYVYSYLFKDAALTPEVKISIIGNIYNILDKHYEIYNNNKPVRVVEEICNHPNIKGKVSATQQVAIVNCIYDVLSDGELTNAEIRYIAAFIFNTVFSGAAAYGARSNPIPELSFEEKFAIIDAVYEVLTKPEYGYIDTTNPQVAPFVELYEDVTHGTDPIVDNETAVTIISDMFNYLVAEEKVDAESATTLVKEVCEQVLGEDSNLSDEKKMQLLDKVTTALDESGLLGEVTGGEGSTSTMPDLSILTKIFNNLKAENLLSDSQAVQIVNKLYPVLLGGNFDAVTLIDDVYGIVFTRPDLTLQDKIDIVVVVYNTLENEGLVSEEIIVEKLQPYYAQAIEELITKGYIDAAKSYILVAQGAVKNALAAVKEYAADEEFAKVKAALEAELEETYKTLGKVYGILSNEHLTSLKETLKVVLELEADLNAHVANITALATEIGIVSAPYITYVIETTGQYVNHVNGILQDAYALTYTSIKDFAVQYAALVETIGSAADKVDPKLGAAVRKFMNETPADVLAIVYAYGEDATIKLCVDAAAAAKEIYTQIVTLAGLLEDHGELIYEAILADQKCQDLYARLLATKAELEALAAQAATAPTATALALYAQIDKIKADLADLATEFYYAAISAVDAVDSDVANALADSIEALMTSIGIAGNAAGNYITWFPGQVEAMAGEVLASIVANWDEFATVAGPIIDQLIITTVEAIKDYVEGVIKDVENQIRHQIGVLEETLEDLKDKAVAEANKQIQAQIEAIEAKIEELKKLLDSDLVKNIVRIGELVLEIKDQVIELAKATDYDAIADALYEIAADLAEIDEILTEVLGERYNAFIDQIGNLGETVLKDLLDAAIKYAPVLDEKLYEFFYNNPDKVIAFFNEYGYIIEDLAAEYGEEALGVIVVALYLYGEDLVNYIIENPETVLAGILAWADKYGDRVAAILQVYADALGICPAVQAEIAALEAQLEALKAQLETAVGEAKKEIEAQIAALEAKIADLKAKLQNLIDSISNLDEALEELVEAGIAAGSKAVLEAIAALNTAVRELMDSVSEELAIRLETLLNNSIELTKELVADLAELAVESAIKFAPMLDEALYNYFYNNPEEVIAFFNEYGDEIVELMKEYGDEALGVVAIALYLYGEELAEYIIENPEDVLAGLIAWADKYGERVVAIMQVYAEALGLCDAVRGDMAALEAQLAALKAELDSKLNTLNNKLMAELAALEAQLAALNAKLETAVGEAKAQIEAEIAKIEAMIAELQDEIEQIKAVIAEIQAVIAVVEKNLYELNEKLQALVDALFNLDDALMYLVNVGVEAGAAVLQAALDAVADAVLDLIGVFSDEVEAQLKALLEQAKAALNQAYLNAIHADYVIDQNSAYVALGDGTVNVEAFAAYLEQLVAEANLGYTYDTTDLTLADSKISALPEIIAQNLATIATSDLISIGYGYDELAQQTVYVVFDLLLQGKTNVATDVDWVALVGADAAEVIEEKIAEVYATLVAEGLNVTLNEMLNMAIATSNVTIADALIAAVEYFAYYTAEYAIYMPQVVNAIHEINSDALVMVLAMSNPLAGTTLSLMGNEIAFGDYLDYVSDAINVEGVVYAALAENVVFVTATEVETNHTNVTISVDTSSILTLYQQYIFGKLFEIETTEAGNAYAVAKMIESLNITVTLDRSGILGDVNGDGFVTFVDAILIARYEAKLETEINTGVADVDGDGHIGFVDAILVARYEAGLITTFPASK